MENARVVDALRRKRTSYCSELAVLNHRRRELVANVQRMDDALRLFGADPGPAAEKRPRLWMFRRGELKRMVCAAIREAGPEIGTRDIARAIIAQMDWDAADERLARLVTAKVKDVRKALVRYRP